MRFAFVVNNYPPRVGGVELHVYSLARHLRSLGHDVVVVTLSSSPGTQREDGIQVIRLKEHLRVGGVLGFPAVGTTRLLTRKLKEYRPDVVSIHTRFFPMSWIGLRAGHRVRSLVLHTEHGSGYVVSPSALVRTASRVVDHTIGTWVLRRADGVLGVSEQVVQFVERLSGRPARVFFNAIETSVRPDATPDAYRLVFVGRLVPGKGWEVFLDVVGLLVERGHAVTAAILGDGEDRAALEAEVTRRGMSNIVEVRGRVTPDEVRAELAGATLVNPTTLAEGFQTTLLEAIAENGAVATFPVPGAGLLRNEGLPVAIVNESTVEALADAVVDAGALPRAADSAAEAEMLRTWFWPSRAREYVAICAALVSPDVRRGSGEHPR